MVARSETEFELFQKMDLERRRDDAKLGTARKARLMEISELPHWLVKEDDEVDPWNYDDNDSVLGRGTRHRKEVDYTDSLTEKEWLKVNNRLNIIISLFQNFFSIVIHTKSDLNDVLFTQNTSSE